MQTESTQQASTRKTLISWPHLVLAALGLAVSAYAVVVKNRIAAGSDSGCGISESINCDAVIGSVKWGSFLGIPWGVWGMVFFVIVALTAVSSTQNMRQFVTQQFAVATVGFLFALGLLYISKVVIGAWCPVCLATHAVLFTLFGVSLYKFLRLSKADKGT
jgi:uncharacterized membrane protein